MSGIVDTYITYRIITILTKPWEEQDAYEFGIIDDKGKVLRKARELKTRKEKDSYTVSLLNKGIDEIAQKVSEETAETIIEAIKGKKKLAIQESSDLLYHLIVMWSKLGINPSQIWNELDKRMKKPEKKVKRMFASRSGPRKSALLK